MTKAPLPYFILSSLRTACTNGGKDDRKSVEVVWICAKSIGGTAGEESRLHVFSPVKRSRGKPRRTLEEIVKRNLVVNNIPENLVSN